MKVLIDFREAAKENRAGKGEYVRQLVLALLQSAPDWEFVLLTTREQIVGLPDGNWSQKTFDGGIFWHLWVWLWCEFRRPADIYFATTSAIVPALLKRVPSIMTIFDFTVWRYPEPHLSHAVRIEKIFIPFALKNSKHLLSISNFTKREAIELLHVSDKKITTTLLGVSNDFKPLDLKAQSASWRMNRLKHAYNLPEKFILYLGTLEPRKNIPLLISAFNSIKDKHSDIKLVLVGNLGWQSSKIKEMLSDDIIVTGYIKDEDKPTIYNMAEVFVFPSLYEGFGMPPLEAMACGVPTIVSNVASLPEVVKDGAMQVDIKNHEALATALDKILSSKDLKEHLRLKGISRAKQLTWEETAKNTIQVLRNYGPRREF